MPALSVNGVAITGGQANFLNSNGISFGINGSSLTASSSAVPSRFLSQLPSLADITLGSTSMPQTSVGAGAGTTTSSYSISVYPFGVPMALTVGALVAPFVIQATTTHTVTNSQSVQLNIGLYSITGSTLTRISTDLFNYSFNCQSSSHTLRYWLGTTSTANSSSLSSSSPAVLTNSLAGTRLLFGTGVTGSLDAGQYFAVAAAMRMTGGAGAHALAFGFLWSKGGLDQYATGGFGATTGSYGIYQGSYTTTLSSTNQFAALLPASIHTSLASSIIAAPAFHLRYTS